MTIACSIAKENPSLRFPSFSRPRRPSSSRLHFSSCYSPPILFSYPLSLFGCWTAFWQLTCYFFMEKTEAVWPGSTTSSTSQLAFLFLFFCSNLQTSRVEGKKKRPIQAHNVNVFKRKMVEWLTGWLVLRPCPRRSFRTVSWSLVYDYTTNPFCPSVFALSWIPVSRIAKKRDLKLVVIFFPPSSGRPRWSQNER